MGLSLLRVEHVHKKVRGHWPSLTYPAMRSVIDTIGVLNGVHELLLEYFLAREVRNLQLELAGVRPRNRV